MPYSMTSYATRTGTHGEFTWVWDIRSVNGKGLDLRLRVPDWIGGLEPALRKALASALTRGNVQASLKMTRSESMAGLRVDSDAVAAVLDAIERIEGQAAQTGVALTPTRAIDVLNARGVLESAALDDGGPDLAQAVISDIVPLLADFIEMRAHEGDALTQVIAAQLHTINDLTAQAQAVLPDRAAAQAEAFRAGLARVMGEGLDIDPGKLAQELAQLAIKSDVTEEVDRLKAHITAAQDMLAAKGPIGRKLDFLCQEFNREANTLCAKSNDAALTAIGLEIKVTIDQMREQIQNVE